MCPSEALILLYGWINLYFMTCFTVYSFLVNIWVVSTIFDYCKYCYSGHTFRCQLSILVWYLGMALLDHVVIFLAIWQITKPFPTTTVPFYISTISIQGFQFLFIFANTCWFLFYYNHPHEWKKKFHFKICICLMTSEIVHLPYACRCYIFYEEMYKSFLF